MSTMTGYEPTKLIPPSAGSDRPHGEMVARYFDTSSFGRAMS